MHTTITDWKAMNTTIRSTSFGCAGFVIRDYTQLEGRRTEMTSIEEWADRLSKIRRGIDPGAESVNESSDFEGQQAKIDAIRRGGTSPDLKALLESRLSEAPSERAAYQADAVKSYAPGTLEEGIARTIPRGIGRDIPDDQSAGAKLARAVKLLRNTVYGEQEGLEGQGTDEQGLHDYEKAPAPKVYPKGKLGGVARGIESVTGALRGIMGDQPGEATARDYDLVREGNQENRGAANIMGNIARIGARRRVGEEELTHAREDRSVNLDYKRAQAENLRSLGSWRQDKLGIEASRAETARIIAVFREAKSAADITHGISDAEAEIRRADAAVLTAETGVRNATTREAHETALQDCEAAKAAAKAANDARDYGLQLRKTVVSERREKREASGVAGLNDLRSAQAAQARANAGKAGSFSQGLIDKATAAKLQKDIDNILKMNKLMLINDADAQERLRQLGVDVPVNEPGFWETLKRKGTEALRPAPPDTTDEDEEDNEDEEDTPFVPPTPAQPSKKGMIHVIGPDGKGGSVPADQVDAWLKANPRGRIG